MATLHLRPVVGEYVVFQASNFSPSKVMELLWRNLILTLKFLYGLSGPHRGCGSASWRNSCVINFSKALRDHYFTTFVFFNRG